MFALIFLAFAVAVVARLAVVVRHDRSMAPPRSHTYELEPGGDRFRVI